MALQMWITILALTFATALLGGTAAAWHRAPMSSVILKRASASRSSGFGALFRIDDDVTYPVAMLNLPPRFR
jgi:hypothetical protein